MDISPEQLRAARAMLNLDQADLARRANKQCSTIVELERVGRTDAVNEADLIDIRRTLERMGIEFIPRGVRRAINLTTEQQALLEKLRTISRISAERLDRGLRLSDDDLYDENGLPA